jgi:hypothetical protein
MKIGKYEISIERSVEDHSSFICIQWPGGGKNIS